MKKLKRLLLVVAVLIVVAIGIVFTLDNQQPISLLIFGRALPQLPSALLLAVAFLLGMIIGPIATMLTSLRRRRMPSKHL